MKKDFKPEEPVQIWDYLYTACDDEDLLPGHSSIGFIIRKSQPEDIGDGGKPLGALAKDCWMIAVPGQKKAIYHYHQEWVRKV